jgi:uncharacterized protein (DUF169 family)
MQAEQIQALLGLRRPPVAITFQASPPPGVKRVEARAPSSCTYWKRAAEGETFYTEAPDHHGCPIGAYTHGVELTGGLANDLQGVVSAMLELGYLKKEEVPGIPRRAGPFGVAVYAPLGQTPTEPDVVLVAGNARQVMLLAEAAQAAGIGGGGLMGRPTCAALPQAQATGRGVASLGCIGNRVYTELGDDELYFALPGSRLGAVVGELGKIVGANAALEEYHQAKKG